MLPRVWYPPCVQFIFNPKKVFVIFSIQKKKKKFSWFIFAVFCSVLFCDLFVGFLFLLFAVWWFNSMIIIIVWFCVFLFVLMVVISSIWSLFDCVCVQISKMFSSLKVYEIFIVFDWLINNRNEFPDNQYVYMWKLFLKTATTTISSTKNGRLLSFPFIFFDKNLGLVWLFDKQFFKFKKTRSIDRYGNNLGNTRIFFFFSSIPPRAMNFLSYLLINRSLYWLKNQKKNRKYSCRYQYFWVDDK